MMGKQVYDYVKEPAKKALLAVRLTTDEISRLDAAREADESRSRACRRLLGKALEKALDGVTGAPLGGVSVTHKGRLVFEPEARNDATAGPSEAPAGAYEKTASAVGWAWLGAGRYRLVYVNENGTFIGTIDYPNEKSVRVRLEECWRDYESQ